MSTAHHALCKERLEAAGSGRVVCRSTPALHRVRQLLVWQARRDEHTHPAKASSHNVHGAQVRGVQLRQRARFFFPPMRWPGTRKAFCDRAVALLCRAGGGGN
jgi:hypothetical protein